MKSVKNPLSLNQALERKYYRQSCRLIEQGQGKSFTGSNPLQLVIENKWFDLVAPMLEQGYFPHGLAESVSSPLRAALVDRQPLVAKRLLAAGADMFEVSKDGNPAYFALVKWGRMEDRAFDRVWPCMEVLLEAGFDVAEHPVLFSLLSSAAPQVESWTPFLEALLPLGADINEKNNGGNTVLFLAARTENKALIRLLLEKGADPKITNKLNQTPREFCVATSHKTESWDEALVVHRHAFLEKALLESPQSRQKMKPRF